MAKIEVKTQGLTSCSEQLKGLSIKLNEYAAKIDEVSKSLTTLKNPSMDRVQKSVASLNNTVLGEAACLEGMSSVLYSIASHYDMTEQRILSNIPGEQSVLVGLQTIELLGAAIFDGSGEDGYGGDQRDLSNEHNWFIEWLFGKDTEVYDFVREHEGFENYTDKEIRKLFEQMKDEGCGYIAIVNTIFSEFEGTEEEFEALFGFPMRNKDGDYNYNYMFIDLYCMTDDKFYLDVYPNEDAKDEALHAHAKGIHDFYEKNPKKFKKIYGIEWSSDSVIEDLIEKIESEGDVATINESGTNSATIENHVRAYFKEKEIDANITYEVLLKHNPTTDEIKELRGDGKVVLLSLDKGTYMDHHSDNFLNNFIYDQDLKGGHVVTVTGVTDDGKYIVSSWGKEFYVDPDQAKYTDYPVKYIDIEFN